MSAVGTDLQLRYADYVAEPDGTGFRQRDLTCVVPPTDYQSYYLAIDENVRRLANKRLGVLDAFNEVNARYHLLDFGCGTGRFVEVAREFGWDACGCDLVRPIGENFPFLTESEAVTRSWDVVTFFDSLEHLVDPVGTIRQFDAPVVMVSVPWCHRPQEAEWFLTWKHRRPGMHLWHWNHNTLNRLFAKCGYRMLAMGCWEDDYRPNPEQDEPNILSAIFQKKR